MSKIEFQNRKKFGDEHVDNLKNKNVDFQKMKKGEMTKKEFIDKYPKSQTAKKYYNSPKAYRDYKKSLKKEDIEHIDAYDMVLEYLFATEQVSTLEEANYVMMEMDQQTVGEIVTEVKQELHELLPLAGLALGGLAVNALRKRGKAKRQGKGGSPFKPAGTAAGRSALAPPLTFLPTALIPFFIPIFALRKPLLIAGAAFVIPLANILKPNTSSICCICSSVKSCPS